MPVRVAVYLKQLVGADVAQIRVDVQWPARPFQPHQQYTLAYVLITMQANIVSFSIGRYPHITTP
jgi:hypothetical protein